MNYFYTNGIQLNAGVTYSASVWYATEYYGYTNWSDFSIFLGPNQSPTGLVSLASTNGPAVAQIYSSLSGIFVVPTSGVYYMAIRATGGSTVGAEYLRFDDVRIQVACPNSNNINLVTSSSVICSGTGAVSFTATSPNTHSWSTGATGTVTTFTTNLVANSTVTVVGTNTLSGCSTTASMNMIVNPSPNVILYSSIGSQSVCPGQSLSLTAFGANSHTWSTGQQTNSIVVSPTVTTNYTVIGTNNYGCSSSAVQLIHVKPSPVLIVSSAIPSNTICEGESDTLTVSGASTYTWTFAQSQVQGSQIVVSPLLSTTYSVSGTSVNGCSSQTSFILSVNGCTGINQLSKKEAEIKIFPNPFQDELVLSTGTKAQKLIEITDLSGRVILSITSQEEEIIVNTKYYANGVYYVKVISDNGTSRLKVIKN